MSVKHLEQTDVDFNERILKELPSNVVSVFQMFLIKGRVRLRVTEVQIMQTLSVPR